MKTKLFALTVGILLLAFSATEAKNPDVKSENCYSKYLEKEMSYPEYAMEQKIEGTVKVLVELDENKELKIAEIWGSDDGLVKYVERRVKKMAKKHGPFNNLTDNTKLICIKFELKS